MTYFRKFCYLNSSWIRKGITLLFISFSKNKFTLFLQNSVTDVSVGFHPPCWSSSRWAPAGVSIQISVSLGKTFLRISRIRNIPLTSILARVFIFVYVPSFISQILDFIYWTVLNGVTLKTSNTFTYNIHPLTVLFCALCLNLLSFVINFLEVVKKFK